MQTSGVRVRIAATEAGQHRTGFDFSDPFTVTKRRRFVSRFGVDPFMVALLWNTIIGQVSFPLGATVVHLLWSLNFLKTYDTESNIAVFFGVDEKTYRKWNWAILQALATMQVINFDDRFRMAPVHLFTFLTVDGTDFKIMEPHPFSPMWFSHKFHHAGLRYEVAISIFTGLIVWVKGPFPCGTYSDHMIAGLPDGLEAHMMPYETYFADDGYRHCLRSVTGPSTADLRARHETANGMFKEFRALRDVFRHNINKHHIVAGAVMNIIALRVQYQTPLNENVNVNIGLFPGPP